MRYLRWSTLALSWASLDPSHMAWKMSIKEFKVKQEEKTMVVKLEIIWKIYSQKQGKDRHSSKMAIFLWGEEGAILMISYQSVFLYH